ncbi:MAG TPA: glutamate--tRNA ligase [Burkholderiaceae bacterium]|nr:glutamate--tRNA ligase [Burkholderiaceae bacterium]HQR69732.1 glutamate--tRNA ligase [Burkholderiaceae bacterium]
MTTVRTRIAPSPTGMLHLGTARTALFSWAFARHHGGQFILRIEDTDLERSTEEAVQVILDSMKWLDLDYDEGPVRQTARLDRYRDALDRLIAEDKAYHCYASKEELDQLRESQMARGEKPRYDGRWRPENARGRTPPPGVKPVVRFRNPDSGDVGWNDLVKGPISISNAELDDLVLARGDGVPTYNFAVVVDDIDMGITHVLRGDDHVNNTPRQINIYRALGAPLPQFGHLPMILGPDGQKLSKRHGAVSVMQYDADGFLPEALFNYLARLGWSHGDAEKFSRAQLVDWFDLDHVNRAPAQYNLDKLMWLNGEYIKEADDARLVQLVAPRITAHGGNVGAGPALERVVALLKDRARTLNELAEAALLFYAEPVRDAALLGEHLQGAGGDAVRLFAERSAAIAWERGAINGLIKQIVAELKVKMPQVAVPLRVAVTGRTQTPSIDAVLELVGREAVQVRIAAALAAAG